MIKVDVDDLKREEQNMQTGMLATESVRGSAAWEICYISCIWKCVLSTDKGGNISINC